MNETIEEMTEALGYNDMPGRPPRTRTLKDELIAAIQNEAVHFDMSRWIRFGASYTAPATCGTASCMAGHIEALRPELAKQLAPLHTRGFMHKYISHEDLAKDIWEREMGEPCNLDFHAHGCIDTDDDFGDKKEQDEITREEAIAHIQGTCPHWPQLDTDNSPESY